MGKVAAYEEHEAALSKEVCLPPDPEVKSSKTLLLEFSKKIESVWSRLNQEASRRGLVLPEKLTSEDFGIDMEHGPADYQVFYSYLAIVQQALEALVTSGITYVSSPTLIAPESPDKTQVVGSESHYCLYRGVAFSVKGSYSSGRRVLIQRLPVLTSSSEASRSATTISSPAFQVSARMRP